MLPPLVLDVEPHHKVGLSILSDHNLEGYAFAELTARF